MSPLNPGTVEQDLRLQALLGYCRDDALDCISVRQLGDMNPSFSTDAVDDLISSGRVGFVSL